MGSHCQQLNHTKDGHTCADNLHSNKGTCRSITLKELAHAGLAKKIFLGVNVDHFSYGFSVAFISALAFLKYANLRLSAVV